MSSEPRKILVAIGSQDSVEGALVFAAAEAVRRGCGVHVVHVVHALVGLRSGTEELRLVGDSLTLVGTGALARAETILERLVPEELAVTTELVTGPITRTLVNLSEHACLTVLQRRDIGRLERVVTASVTTSVAARAHGPVVVVPAGWVAEDLDAPVTIGVASAAESLAVVKRGLEAARASGCSARLVHTWWFSEAFDDLVFAGEPATAWTRRVREELESELAEVFADFQDVPVLVVVGHGRPADALAEESGRSSLVVVGRRDPVLPVGSHLGPVPRAVLRASHCPVLVVEPA